MIVSLLSLLLFQEEVASSLICIAPFGEVWRSARTRNPNPQVTNCHLLFLVSLPWSATSRRSKHKEPWTRTAATCFLRAHSRFMLSILTRNALTGVSSSHDVMVIIIITVPLTNPSSSSSPPLIPSSSDPTPISFSGQAGGQE